MAHDWKLFEHPDRLSVQPGDPLLTFLKGNACVPVRVSLRHQKRTDSLVVQVLLTAAKAWKRHGLGFDVIDLPPRLMQEFATLGLSAETTGWSGLK